MSNPNPQLEPHAALEILDARTILSSAAPRRRMCGGLARLPGGRLLLTFALGAGGDVRRNDGAIMLTRSDDGGRTWDEPLPLYAYPGWDCFPMSGLAALAGNHLRLVLGRIKLDFALGGDEPFAGWQTAFTDSRDGGATWSEPAPAPELFPCWTEFYGASNPHPLADGRLLWAVIGTQGRDVGWQAGVTVSDAAGSVHTPPVVIAAAPDRNYSDTDLLRLADGRFLAVSREHVTKESVFSHSADEGATWTPLRPTGFKGANIKLFSLRSGLILCAYRDEDPARRGVSCSASADGGVSWRLVGQLYAAESDVPHRPGHLCGYPDFVALDGDEIVATLHSYPDADGRVDLQLLRLRDRT